MAIIKFQNQLSGLIGSFICPNTSAVLAHAWSRPHVGHRMLNAAASSCKLFRGTMTFVRISDPITEKLCYEGKQMLLQESETQKKQVWRNTQPCRNFQFALGLLLLQWLGNLRVCSRKQLEALLDALPLACWLPRVLVWVLLHGPPAIITGFQSKACCSQHVDNIFSPQ